MSDRVPPKGKKAGKGKKPVAVKKAPGPKLVKSELKGIGHNSGEIVPELKKLVSEILASAARQKAESKLQRDLRNRAKTEFGILASVLAEEIKKQKMDDDVRVQYEVGQEDIKKMLGYQPTLDFAGAEPTKTSVKAQPKEADMPKPLTDADHPAYDEDDEEGYSVEDEDDDGEGDEPEHNTDNGLPVGRGGAPKKPEKDPLEIPENLRRHKPDVIEREG